MDEAPSKQEPIRPIPPEAESGREALLPLERLDAVLFDMDGVITNTASLHAAAWKEVFDGVLLSRAGPAFDPFDIDEDYRMHVDGKPRYEGVQAFLSARGIALPWGRPDDSPEANTVCGIGNRKDIAFGKLLQLRGVEVFASTIALVHELNAKGIRTGVCSSSQHAALLLSSAGVEDLFEAKVDGIDVQRFALPGKPHPAMFLELARRLAVAPARTAVVEDAIAGVEAGKAGHFAFVVGINRTAIRGELLRHGADIEVSDLSELHLGSA